MIIFLIRDNYVPHNLDCTFIHRALPYSFRSNVTINPEQSMEGLELEENRMGDDVLMNKK